MCADLLEEFEGREIRLTTFLNIIQKELKDERNSVINLSNELSETKDKLKEVCSEHNELQEKYGIMKQKFDTMKSLFS